MNDFLTRFRILPLLVLVALAAFAVRIGDTWLGMRNMAAEVMAQEALKLQTIQPAAGTEENTEEKSAEKSKEKAEAEESRESGDENAANADGDEPQPSKGNEPKVSLPDATLPEVWADPGAESMADSPEQVQLLEDLSARRQELDARERTLLNREALLQATEKQIDDKITELSALKDQIEKLLGQQESEENDKIQSLVKIYEGMKAKDAADIFNQMDMDILVQVVSKMNERKASPVIAAMDTTKANQLTVRLTEMKKLPAVKTGGNMEGGSNPVPTAAPAGSAALPGLDALGQP